MSYRLSGFAAPTAHGPTFLVPFFVKRGSNAAYVQQLDENYVILAFWPFDASDVPRTLPPPYDLRRTLHQDGVLGFVRPDDRLVFGTSAEIASQLKTVLPELADFPFASLDLLRFLARNDEVERAVYLASRRIGGKFALKWAKAELHVSDNWIEPRQARALDLDRILDELQAGLSDRAWQELWQRTWTRYPGEPRLAEVGLNWADRVQSNKRALAIYDRLFGDRLAKPTAQSSATQRLIRSRGDESWARIYSRLPPAMRKSTLLREKALQLLVGDEPHRIGVSGWTKLWRIMRRDVGPDPRLLDLVPVEIPRLKPYRGRGLFRLIAQYFRDRPNENQSLEVLTRWFPDPDSRENTWADLFVNYLAKSPHDKELLALGEGWLSHSSPDLRTWPVVWRAVMEADSSRPRVHMMGARWLKTTNAHWGVWPQVLVSLLRAGVLSDDVVSMAKEWMDRNPHDARRRHIEDILG
jgi:hypothetical protein